MPLAFTHSVFNLATTFLVKSKLKINLPKYWPIFAIFSGLVPDLDFGFQYLLSFFGFSNTILSHGMFFHSIGFVLLLLGISMILHFFNKDYGLYALIISFGSLLHITLDYLLGGGAYYLMLLYPISNMGFRLHLLEPLRNYEIYAILDAAVIVLCLVYLYFVIRNQSQIHHENEYAK